MYIPIYNKLPNIILKFMLNVNQNSVSTVPKQTAIETLWLMYKQKGKEQGPGVLSTHTDTRISADTAEWQSPSYGRRPVLKGTGT